MPFKRVLAVAIVVSVAGAAVAGLTRSAAAEEGDVSVGGVWVSKITHDAAGFSAVQRAAEVNKRITEILSEPRYRQEGAVISVRPLGDAAVILVGGQLIFTVMPEDAAGTGVSTVTLARQWAERLSRGLSNALPDAIDHSF